MSIAEKLSHVKRLRNMTNAEISTRSGVPLGTLNKIFSGETQNPSPNAILQISNVLEVPIRYLFDDSVPIDCYRGAMTKDSGMMFLTPDETKMIQDYRCLARNDRRSIKTVLNEMSTPFLTLTPDAPFKRLICYIPFALGRRGAFGDTFHRKPILVAENPVSLMADFALQTVSHSMEPIYSNGTILLCKQAQVVHNQFGFFLHNREAFVRKYYCKHGKIKLVAANVDLKDVVVHAGDEFKCMGVILGAARDYRWD